MRTEDKAGYICLIGGLVVFYGLKEHTIGLFLQGAALGFFIQSMIKQIYKK